jgi:hypothetical protein
MSEFIEFTVNNPERFERLRRVFLELKKDKDADHFRAEEEWPRYFDNEALDHFHWPTPEERSRWKVESQHRPILIMPTEMTSGLQWDFFSMIDAFQNGEYELRTCELIGPTKGRLEFYALAYPYGGVGCIVALIEAFGFTITGIQDGTGYREMP